uniref:Uncharacterized mitochondrial protein AtMg00810-like n=1 Tax=Nicotiana tabacum TaxID=4097 RepID=A0A1S3YZ70_TOBAC|nr:PREDICTED: uncharacterized mitochondrial protein AtMg00810-like [Nicotiana tabacum]
MVIVRTVIAVAASRHWFNYQMDVHNAFLQGDLLEEVYMTIPEGGDLQKKFKMKVLGELKFFLGIEFARSSKGIHMRQRKYSLELIYELGLGGAKTAGTPLEYNQKLTSIEFDRAFNKDAAHEDPILEDAGEYQRLVGRLLYLTMTRPDISFGVQVLSQYMHSLKQSHMEAALRIVRYLKA